MKLALTGGNGFFGRNFINYLFENHGNYEIINIDNKGSVNTVKGCGNYKFYKADITDFRGVVNILKDVDCVIHFAAISKVEDDTINQLDYTKVNILGTHNLVEAARLNKIKRFIFISSYEVYRKHINSSLNIYAASKIAAETVLSSYYSVYHFPAIIIRATNLFGPFQTPDRIISSFIVNMLNNEKITIKGDGRIKRDHLYVKDACAALYAVLKKGKPGNIYDLASGKKISNIKIAYKILHYFNRDKTWIQYIPKADNHETLSKKNNELKKIGWGKRYSFDDGLQETIEWYKTNKN